MYARTPASLDRRVSGVNMAWLRASHQALTVLLFGQGAAPPRGEAHLRTVLADYQAHYNTNRPHQGIAQRVPDGARDGGHLTVADLDRERIHRKLVLGGLINEYSRAA